MDDKKELVVQQATPSNVVLPLLSAEEMVTAIDSYKRMQAALDRSMPDQIMTIRGRKFRKKGYWRSIRTAFGLSVEQVKEEKLITDNDWGYAVTYRATSPGGTFADGDGTCMASEKPGHNQATEHNVRSHAHTRAFNRAVSNLVGFGEVSAEEMQRDFRPPQQQTVTAAQLGKAILDHVNNDKLAAQQILQNLVGKTSCTNMSSAEATAAYKRFETQYLNAAPADMDDIPMDWEREPRPE